MALIRDESLVVPLVASLYDIEKPEAAWVEGVLASFNALCGTASAGLVRLHSHYDEAGKLHLGRDAEMFRLGPEIIFADTTLDAVMNAPNSEATFGRTQGETFSAASGLGAALPQVPGWSDCWTEGVVDSLGIVSRDARGDIVLVSNGLRETSAATPREGRLFLRVAAHLGNGNRLRRVRETLGPDAAEAVLSPDGVVLHAEAKASEHREEIHDGHRRRAHAATETSGEKALAVWTGLISGRWSLVDFIDTDGKRLILAQKNAPVVDRRAELTPRERRVAALVAMGHRDKEIAYMLGLRTGSVSGALRRARTKLGATSRAELASHWRRTT